MFLLLTLLLLQSLLQKEMKIIKHRYQPQTQYHNLRKRHQEVEKEELDEKRNNIKSVRQENTKTKNNNLIDYIIIYI